MRVNGRAPDAVRTVLEEVASPVKETTWGCWHFQLSNGKPVPTTARFAGDWVLLDAPLSANPDDDFDPWVLIGANRGLGGFAKFTLDPFDLRPHVQADVPSWCENTNDQDLATRVKRACEGLEHALERYSDPKVIHDDVSLGGAGAAGGDSVRRTSSTDLIELCSEGGWTARERERGDVVVDLETGTGYWQARLRSAADPGDPSVTASVRLPLRDDSFLENLPDDPRLALGVHLLTSGATGRLMRASIERYQERAEDEERAAGESEAVHQPEAEDEADRGRVTPCFEVRFDEAPSGGELNRALCALSVACRFFAQEAQILQIEAVANRYLALRYHNGRGHEGAGHKRRK